MPSGVEIDAWQPRVEGVVEVFHARFTAHSYPMHVHDVWTLLIIDDGAVRYDLDRHEHGTPRDAVTLLPPDVPHNGQPVTPHGFRKRVVYLDRDLFAPHLVGAAVATPDLADPLLRDRVDRLHRALARPGDELEAAGRLTLITERLGERLVPGRTPPALPPAAARGVAHSLRDLLDSRIRPGISLEEAARTVHAHPAHLVRSFSAAFGIAPHQYLMSRRVDRARRLLLDGVPAGEVAHRTGFYDQSHLTRHFKRVVGTTPGRYAAGRTRAGRRGHRTAAGPAAVRQWTTL
ncbi:AraC family transcriptional regulator [Streptomyces sp. WAC06614]|uniref:helix-turn-helix transcriptional regulator n=1 Tax=Streptomyces sp. WAC06614 TaxID=2487416 RepID=UPI000F7902B3|nr:AraC family transcriptional regulator [Streptomyces sp. WAC06614]RSS81010.1 AraC family transcriptional regulator [Streptomyces sp. WAC06614]